jgi:dCTP deaminase
VTAFLLQTFCYTLPYMILSDNKILEHIAAGVIVIEPFDRKRLGPNSYDVCLNKILATYIDTELDAKKHNKIELFEISEEGFLLVPGELYLGTTVEHTETYEHVPILEGKSSTGRLGIDIHATAGIGDVGYIGSWTLEISVKKPVRVYAGMPIGQMIYHEVSGEVSELYHKKPTSKYWNDRENIPRESMMWKNFL